MPEIKQKDENLNIKETNKAKNDEKNIKANDDKIMPNDNDQKENESKDDEIFNFDNLRLSQDFFELAGVKKAIVTIPVRKPNRHEFIRVRPGKKWRYDAAVLELKEEREIYLLDLPLFSEFSNDLTPKIFFTTINRQNVLTLWPIRLPGEDGRLDQWNQSALRAAKMAETHWIRLASNMSLGAYEIFTAQMDLPDPEWPEVSFQEILDIAFKGKIIDSDDHPVIQRLRGCV
jgi:hypothetical protein